jgi:hypothetical protein
MQEFDEYYNIRVGDEVCVTQLFEELPDVLSVDPAKFSQILSRMNNGPQGEVETRTGIIESIDNLDAALWGINFRVSYPNGNTHGATIEQLRPRGCLMVMGDELLFSPKGLVGNAGHPGQVGEPGLPDGVLYVEDDEIVTRAR